MRAENYMNAETLPTNPEDKEGNEGQKVREEVREDNFEEEWRRKAVAPSSKPAPFSRSDRVAVFGSDSAMAPTDQKARNPLRARAASPSSCPLSRAS